MLRGVRAMWIRGGTSKGGYFLAGDLPDDRDAFLLRAMGSPDPRQIDGMGGGDPLRSKVAVVRPSRRPGVDVEYLFLQVAVDRPVVSDAQNCGNILAGVGPFAIERGLVPARDGVTAVVIHMENSGRVAEARVQTPGGAVCYEGRARIDGVPGTAAPVAIGFRDIAGASCGALWPTGQPCDMVDGIALSCIDNGMPVVLLRAGDLGLAGDEPPEQLEADAGLRARLEAIRLEIGPRMNLGDVADKTVPKMVLVSAPRGQGVIATRSFIPHRCHRAIGVFGAVSVATACLIPGSVAHALAHVPAPEGAEGWLRLGVEHPAGMLCVLARRDAAGGLAEVAIESTARKLMDGEVFG